MCTKELWLWLVGNVHNEAKPKLYSGLLCGGGGGGGGGGRVPY